MHFVQRAASETRPKRTYITRRHRSSRSAALPIARPRLRSQHEEALRDTNTTAEQTLNSAALFLPNLAGARGRITGLPGDRGSCAASFRFVLRFVCKGLLFAPPIYARARFYQLICTTIDERRLERLARPSLADNCGAVKDMLYSGMRSLNIWDARCSRTSFGRRRGLGSRR